jgi:acetyl esterase/lipase
VANLPGRLIAGALDRLPEPWLLRLAGGAAPAIRGRTLDPRLQLIAKLGSRQTPFHQLTAAEARAAASGALLFAAPPRPMAHVDSRAIPGPAGNIPVRLATPHGLAGRRPLILYFHQGGCVIGDLDWCLPFATLLAETARCPVLMVDYRKGPEHRFPAAQEDAVAAYRWALAHAAEVGGDPERLVVAGDSAGGGLSAHVTHAARRAGDPQPRLQVLIYPWLHAYADNESYRDFAASWPLTPEGMRWFLANYANGESDWRDPRLSPLLEDDFAGLAPALVYTAGFDPLCDEGLAYAEKLGAAGVPATYRCYEHLCHSFTSLGALAAPAEALAEIARDVERVLTGGTP